MCCGQGRAAIRAGTARGSASLSRAAPATTELRYVGGKHVRIRGEASARLYEFRGGQRLPVDTRDVAAMVRTGLFSRS